MSNLDTILSHLADQYIESFPGEAARLLEQQNLSEIKTFIGELEASRISILFKYLHPHLSNECLLGLPPEKAISVLTNLSPEFGASILRLSPKTRRENILSQLPKKISRTLHALIHYPAGSAGALMDPNTFDVSQDQTVEQVKKIIKNMPKKEFNFLYLVDRDGVYQGRISFLDFLRADPDKTLNAIRTPPLPVLFAEASSPEILTHSGWRDFPEIPVVDEEKRLLGAIHFRILRDLEEEMGEAIISPLTTMMELGESTWVGMMASYQHLWGLFHEQFTRDKS